MSAYLRLLRPTHWIKNSFVFAALAFGAKLNDPHAVALALAAFAAFCLASSAGYAYNDVRDCERDRHHPIKRNRPVASGEITPGAALTVMFALLGLAALISALFLPAGFGVTLGGYLILTITYSVALKNRMLLDVITIALLFVLRALGGALAISVTVSPWLLVCTFMLCLFLGFGKRRCEITMLQSDEAIRDHRQTLVRYTPDLLNQLLSTSGGIAIITFLLYTLDPHTTSPFQHKSRLLYTLPLVVYGIYRYAMLIELGKAAGPTELILKDRAFLTTIILWVLVSILILYFRLPLPS